MSSKRRCEANEEMCATFYYLWKVKESVRFLVSCARTGLRALHHKQLQETGL